MSDHFQGKSIFIWNVPAILGGDPVQIAVWLKAHGFESVMVKCADGPYVFHPSWSAFPNWLTSMLRLGRPNVDRHFVEVLHSYGLKVYGWGFNYGRNGDGEGRIAAQQCDALGLDGWIFDVEGEFENRTTAIQDAGKVLGTFMKTIITDVPLCYCGWSDYWSPSGLQWHNARLAQFFMSVCDVGMMMLYWGTRGADGKPVVTPPARVEFMLRNSLQQWKMITSKPIVPAGRAYTGDGGIASAESVTAFGNLARQLCRGASYWVLDHAIKMPLIADALRLTPAWDGAEPPPPIEPPVPVPGRYVGRVNPDVTLGLNVRVTASTSAKSLGKLAKNTPFEGDIVQIGADGKSWLHITQPLIGWIATWYIKYEDTQKDVTL